MDADRQADNGWVGAFLLVIPGMSVFGAGIGLAFGQAIAGAVAGLGLGAVAWGVVVSVLRK
ncbi:MAG TPA: hypothetical protein VI056_11730 [Candidatus Limnocylindria bacterium]